MGKPIATYTATKNTFLANVVEKIGRQDYSSKAYVNSLARFKKGFIKNANEIEEIYVARIQSLTQDLTGADTLARVLPNVSTAYHKQNYAQVYTASVSDAQVRRAFTTDNGVRKIADEILTQLSTGYEYDEYVAMKSNIEDFADILPTDAKKTITDITDQESAKAFIKQLKKDYKLMQFRSTKYCKYETNSKADDIVLVIDTNVMAEIEVEWLASAFNKTVADIPSMIVEVDGFTKSGLKAVLMDTGAMKVFDTLYNLETQRNAKGMFTNHHLNVEKIISVSDMYNGASYTVGA